MYEYQTTTHYGTSAPISFNAPTGFRLRDIKYVESGRSISYNGQTMNMHPSNSSEMSMGNWIMIWERYVPEQGEL